MRNTMPPRKVIMSLLVVAVLCGVLAFMDRRALLDPLRDGVGTVLSPVLARVEEIGQPTGPTDPLEVQLATAVAERDGLVAENARLRGELDQLEVLRAQLDAESTRQNLDFLPARVVSRDVSGTQKVIIIDKGSDDGLAVGMAVADPNFYIGQIIEVETNKAKILLITDPNANVGARLYDTRADGVVYGNRGSTTLLTMRHIDKDVVPKPQEYVMTSDLFESETSQVPPNLPIGIVVGEPALNAQNDQLEITIQPAADFQQLETVWIVVPND